MSADERPPSTLINPAAYPIRCPAPTPFAAPLLLFLLIAPGCVTWNAVQAPALESQPAEAVRVTRVDGTVLTLLHPTVRSDSLVGMGEDGWAVVAVALSDVTEIEARRVSAGHTIGLVVGLAAVTVLVVAGLALRSIGDLEGWQVWSQTVMVHPKPDAVYTRGAPAGDRPPPAGFAGGI